MNLYDTKSGSKYRVIHTPEVAIIHTLGIYVGGVVGKSNTYKFGGPALIEINGRSIAIGKDIAKLIQVEEYKEVL